MHEVSPRTRGGRDYLGSKPRASESAMAINLIVVQAMLDEIENLRREKLSQSLAISRGDGSRAASTANEEISLVVSDDDDAIRESAPYMEKARKGSTVD